MPDHDDGHPLTYYRLSSATMDYYRSRPDLYKDHQDMNHKLALAKVYDDDRRAAILVWCHNCRQWFFVGDK